MWTWQSLILYEDSPHHAVAPLLLPSVSHNRQLLLFHMSHQVVSYSHSDMPDYCEHGYHHSCSTTATCLSCQTLACIFGKPLFVTQGILQPCPLAGEKESCGNSVASVKRSQESCYMRQREWLYETQLQHMALLKSGRMRLWGSKSNRIISALTPHGFWMVQLQEWCHATDTIYL